MNYKTPGVYVQEVSLLPPSVAEVETAIPAFIGFTEIAKKDTNNDLLRVATRIKSMLEYQSFFGGPPNQAITINVDANNLPTRATVTTASDYLMYYALRQFFDNGGGPCYIVSVGDYNTAIVSDKLGTSPTAVPGGLDLIKKIDEITLILFPDAAALGGPSYYDLYDSTLAQCAQLQDRFAIIDLKDNGAAAGDPTTYFRGTNGMGNSNLKYGAAYYPWLQTTLNYNYNSSSITFAQPDDGNGNTGPLDTETLADALDDAATMAPLITTEFIALKKTEIQKLFVSIPPGPAIAGVYATTDRTRGVWKAPANISLNSVIKPLVQINDKDQQNLNVHTSGKSINAIRAFTGRGIIVWGARTLAGNDNEWRYVSVRRFYNMVEESVKKSISWSVFEPNDANTWVKVKGMIDNYLTVLWRAGALAGAKPEQAFFVNVGLNETMTAQDILEGRMIVEIGMAAVRPAEFIILKFSHKMQQS